MPEEEEFQALSLHSKPEKWHSDFVKRSRELASRAKAARFPKTGAPQNRKARRAYFAQHATRVQRVNQ